MADSRTVAEIKEFLASLNPRERALQNLAAEKLGSSYFVEKTHAFTAWKKKKVGGDGASGLSVTLNK